MGSFMSSSKWFTLLPSFMYHLDTQELRICPSLSIEICNFLHPLLRFLPEDQGPSPWMLKPVLSTMRWRDFLVAGDDPKWALMFCFYGTMLCGLEREYEPSSDEIETLWIPQFVVKGGETTISMWEPSLLPNLNTSVVFLAFQSSLLLSMPLLLMVISTV